MGIQGHASLLAAKRDFTGSDHEHLRIIEEQVHKAKELTAQLLGAARGGKYDPRPVVLNELLTSSVSMLTSKIKQIFSVNVISFLPWQKRR